MKAVSTIQHEERSVNMMQDKVVGALNEILANELMDSDRLEAVVLASGSNIISHRLGRKLIGWMVTRNNAPVTIYDTQQTNQIPNKTLVLVASGACTIDLLVF